MKNKILLLLTCLLVISYVPACTKESEPQKEDPQTEQPEEKPENGNPEEDSSKPDPENPEPETPEKPEPEKPVEPDPEKPVEPDPEKPVDPEPEKPVDPEPEKPVEPDPETPVEPDPEDPEGESPLPGKSTVVAFDFTAQYCIYCPNTTRLLLESREQYAGNYIVVTLHSRKSDSPDVYQKEAEEYHKYMISQGTLQEGYPNNIFNSLGSYMEMRLVKDCINDPSFLKIESTVETEGSSLTLNLKSRVCKGQEERMKGREFILMMWLTENDVVAIQSDNHVTGGWDMKYHHMYLFRKALNGLWGEDYVPGKSYSYKATIPDNVVIANSQLVVLVMDKKTKEAVAAVEYPLVKK